MTGNRPRRFLNPSEYVGARILDLSCGNGRNLPLLRDLGFCVYATEISAELVGRLRRRFTTVEFAQGYANAMPFGDRFFDYVMACNSCYYLEPEHSFEDNLIEISRILKPRGVFIGSLPGWEHSVCKGAARCADSSVVVREDQSGIRNGDRIQVVEDTEQARAILSPFFEDLQVGHQTDTCFGFHRDIYYFCGRRA